MVVNVTCSLDYLNDGNSRTLFHKLNKSDKMKLLPSVLALSNAQNLLLNGDFTSETGWSAHGGLDLVYESEANGINYAKVGSRTANWQGMYQDVTVSLDPNQVSLSPTFVTNIV